MISYWIYILNVFKMSGINFFSVVSFDGYDNIASVYTPTVDYPRYTRSKNKKTA